MDRLTKAEAAALARLFVAAEDETPMGHRISRFLLAWWNPAVHGCFDFADAAMVSAERRADMVVVFGAALRLGDGPGAFGRLDVFRRLSHTWLGGDPADTPLFAEAESAEAAETSANSESHSSAVPT